MVRPRVFFVYQDTEVIPSLKKKFLRTLFLVCGFSFKKIALFFLFLLPLQGAQDPILDKPMERGHLPLGLWQEFSKAWPKNRTMTIVFHGHSVPAGYHRTPEVKPFESYPHLVIRGLKERYPYVVLNGTVTAIGGEGSGQGCRRFSRDVLSLRPDLIFLDYALNDRRRPLEEARQSWLDMIRQAQTLGIPMILLTPTGSEDADWQDPRDPLNLLADMIRELGREMGVPVADVFAAWKEELRKGTPQKELLSQVNHPNLKGHTIAAHTILDLLDKESRRMKEKE